MRKLSVCHAVNSVNAGFGGPSVSVTGLVSALATECGVDCRLVTADRPGCGPALPVSGASLHSVPAGLVPLPWGYVPGLDSALRDVIAGADIVHSHGLWLYVNWRARVVARKLGKPLVISPRGMLSEWALRRGGLRKRIALRLFERRTLESCALLHASGPGEAADIRRTGLSQPIAIIPNGVEPPERAGDPSRFRSRSGVVESRIALFLSRLHPGKGLEDLLQTWAALGEEASGWTLVVAGEGESGYVRGLRELAAAGRERIRFVGGAWGEEKEDAFAAADLFVLPSSSESFGMAIAEALARGVPVITTRETPWEAIEKERAGWWVARAELMDALSEALRTSPEDLRRMGEHGRQLAARNLGWPDVARRMSEAYRWLMEGGERPGFVVAD